jgi:hypothetical protein
MLIDVPFHALLNLFRVQSFFTIEEPRAGRVEETKTAAVTRGNPPTNGPGLQYGVEFRGCNLGAALGAIKLGKDEHLLRPGGTAGDSFVGFDRIFEGYPVYSRHL